MPFTSMPMSRMNVASPQPFSAEVLLHPRDALADDHAEAVSARHLVQQLDVRRAVAPCQIQPAGPFRVEDAALVALHRERARGAVRDGVDAVGVAVEVRLEDPVRIEDAAVRAEAGGRFVLGPVHRDEVPLVGSGHHLVAVGALRARHVTAVPAAVEDALSEARLPHRRGDLRRVGMLAVPEVVRRQQVVRIHDLDQVRRPDLAHLALFVVEVVDFLRERPPDLRGPIQLGGVVHVGLQLEAVDNQRLQPLVAEHAPDAAPPRLLQPCRATLRIPQEKFRQPMRL